MCKIRHQQKCISVKLGILFLYLANMLQVYTTYFLYLHMAHRTHYVKDNVIHKIESK